MSSKIMEKLLRLSYRWELDNVFWTLKRNSTKFSFASLCVQWFCAYVFFPILYVETGFDSDPAACLSDFFFDTTLTSLFRLCAVISLITIWVREKFFGRCIDFCDLPFLVLSIQSNWLIVSSDQWFGQIGLLCIKFLVLWNQLNFCVNALLPKPTQVNCWPVAEKSSILLVFNFLFYCVANVYWALVTVTPSLPFDTIVWHSVTRFNCDLTPITFCCPMETVFAAKTCLSPQEIWIIIQDLSSFLTIVSLVTRKVFFYLMMIPMKLSTLQSMKLNQFSSCRTTQNVSPIEKKATKKSK